MLERSIIGAHSVPILTQGDCLIASVLSTLTDSDLLALRDRIAERVMTERSRGVVLDVGGLDVIDSFAVHTLSAMAQMVALRGAATVIVGIRPDVAYSMVQLGLRLKHAHIALDLDEGLEYLRSRPVQLGSSQAPVRRLNE